MPGHGSRVSGETVEAVCSRVGTCDVTMIYLAVERFETVHCTVKPYVAILRHSVSAVSLSTRPSTDAPDTSCKCDLEYQATTVGKSHNLHESRHGATSICMPFHCRSWTAIAIATTRCASRRFETHCGQPTAPCLVVRQLRCASVDKDVGGSQRYSLMPVARTDG